MKTMRLVTVATVLCVLLTCLCLITTTAGAAVAGIAGGAIQFDGDTQIAVVPNSPSLNPTAAITLEAWFMPFMPIAGYASGGYVPVVEKPYITHDDPFYQYSMGPGLGMKFRGFMNCECDTPTYLYGTSPFTVGEWHHFAMTFDGTVLRVYTDGDLEGELTISGPTPPPFPMMVYDTPLTLGKHLNYEAGVIGVIDEVRLWNVARTSEQIAASYDRLIDPTTTGLMGYWNFDEADGQYIFDQTTNNNIGTLGLTDILSSDDPVRVDSTAPLVPEPATMSLLALGGLAMLRRRRK